uniref:Uncharacterized protein n=1 Tax=Peronospora matthiolae TaxID=2874970 RepID=A0AAV1SZA5_9STRA
MNYQFLHILLQSEERTVNFVPITATLDTGELLCLSVGPVLVEEMDSSALNAKRLNLVSECFFSSKPK